MVPLTTHRLPQTALLNICISTIRLSDKIFSLSIDGFLSFVPLIMHEILENILGAVRASDVYTNLYASALVIIWLVHRVPRIRSTYAIKEFK